MSLLKFSFLLSFFLFNSLFASSYSNALKEKKIYPLGKKIYDKKCADLNVNDYNSFEELERDIKKTGCGTLIEKYQEAVLLYLWEKKRVQKQEHHYPKLTVTHQDKCPICGMFLYKYPRWVSMIEYKDGHKLYFDGLKDLFKYYFKHPQNIQLMLTKEYYTQKEIALKDAYFVIGSDVYGPMGNEFIAFKDKKSAHNFLLDHRGKKILRFDEITQEMVYQLDE